MDARTVRRLEQGIEKIASTIFGVAVGFAVFVSTQPFGGQLQVALLAGGAALGAFALSSIAIRATGKRRNAFATPVFDVRAFEPEELLLGPEDLLFEDELVLRNEDRIPTASSGVKPEPLELDDVLRRMEPDSRVVRLFDRDAMPTPGQLRSRIDTHLQRSGASARDDSEALSEALAELRRSLR